MISKVIFLIVSDESFRSLLNEGRKAFRKDTRDERRSEVVRRGNILNNVEVFLMRYLSLHHSTLSSSWIASSLA